MVINETNLIIVGDFFFFSINIFVRIYLNKKKKYLFYKNNNNDSENQKFNIRKKIEL